MAITAESLGCPAPINQKITTMIHEIDEGLRAIGEDHLEELFDVFSNSYPGFLTRRRLD